MTNDEMIQYAAEEGFDAAAVVNTEDIIFDFSFRPYCEENLCGQYGANYSCPPSCGTPEEMKERIVSHKKALVLQTIWEIPDYTDKEAVKKAKNAHNSRTLRLAKRFRANGYDGLTVGASGCELCSPCAMAEGKPCAFPQMQFSCMSAYCIFVRPLAETCGMTYAIENNMLPFFGMYVFD